MTASRLSDAIQACRRDGRTPPNILKTLLAVQEAVGYVPAEAIPQIADALAVPEADVGGVLSYYPDLHVAVVGRHVLRLCLGEACVANRASDLLGALKEKLGIAPGDTTPDGRVTFERVYCLGNCGVGPTVMVDETIYGRVSCAELRTLLEQLAATDQSSAK